MSLPLRSVTFASCLAALLALAGCSAIVNPDPSRLGGTDAPGIDAGPTDAPPVDAPRPDGSIPDGGTDAPIECSSDGQCDDDIPCTGNFCRENRCVFTPDDALCEDDERCSDTAGCVPIRCESNDECVDSNACNGLETCDPDGPGADPRTGCVAGTDLICDDGRTCTVDTCDEAMGCVAAPDDARCDDGVACTVDDCTGTAGPSGCENRPDDAVCNTGCIVSSECSSAGCSPGSRRDCDDDTDCTVDSCDESVPTFCVNEPVDADGDGAPAGRTASGVCPGGTDCDDTNPAIGPGETEVCNGRDDNCNGATDEGCPTGGDDCGEATPITLSGTTVRTATIDGSFGTFSADYAVCSGTGRDAVYYLDLAAGSDVRIDTVGSAVTDTVLAVGTTCALANFSAACNDDQDPGPSAGPRTLTSRIWLHNVGPGAGGGSLRVYILVKSYAGDSTGAFRLNVQVTAPRADSCGSDGMTPLDISGGGLVLGNIGVSTGSSSARGSCDPMTFSGSEAVFRFSGPADNQVWEMEARSSAFRPVLFTRGFGTSSCGDARAETERSCDVGDASGFATVAGVPAESGRSNYVFVDGAGVGGGAYSLMFDP